jgi:hypothetical protein
MSRLLRFLRMPRARQALMLECLAALMRAAWQVRTWPFSRLAAHLGTAVAPRAPDGQTLSDTELAFARAVHHAVHAWLRALPLPPTCLMQAVAARQLLVRRGLACQIYFGVRGRSAALSPLGKDLAAHAWLRCGPLVVTGEHEAANFKAIAMLDCAPPKPA